MSPLTTVTNFTFDRFIGIIVRVFVNGPADLGSVVGKVIPITQKMLVDASLHFTFKVKIKGKWMIKGKE